MWSERVGRLRGPSGPIPSEASEVCARSSISCVFRKGDESSRTRGFTRSLPRPIGVRERETVRAFLTRVTFGFEGFRLRAAARQVLDGLAKSLKSPRQSVWIVGHVEPTESVDQDDLSLLRAREIANYLQQKGIDPSRMTVEGVGASEPSDRSSNTGGAA